MATTTNYGWTTPDDTGLVKDGASAIRSLGTAIDTTTKNLNPSTTLGDIEYRSSTSNTNTRLGIGSTGQVLTVSGGVPTWAAPSGGASNLVQIATGTLSGASVTISSLSSYSELLLFIYDSYNATANGTTQVRINNNSTSNYEQLGYTQSGTSASTRRKLLTQTAIEAAGTQTQDRADAQDLFAIRFFNTKNAGYTSFDVVSSIDNAITPKISYLSGVYKVSEAVSSLVIYQTGGNWSGGTYTLYGG